MSIFTNVINKFNRFKEEREAAKYIQKSFSQIGEDQILSMLFFILKIKRPSYIDIGAYHPFFISNTAKMYFKRGQGINIEPNPIAFEEFKKFRSRDINLNIGISSTKGLLKYYVLDSDTLNTFSEEEAYNCEKQGHKILKTIDIEVDTIDNVLRKYTKGIFPDFMNLDVEGLEMDVLESIDFNKTKPKVICMEMRNYTKNPFYSKKNEDLINYLDDKGYFVYADTYLNAILLSKDQWSSLKEDS